jgi:light-regulated signal transduction histidine kinase (bacteriophytochrome)
VSSVEVARNPKVRQLRAQLKQAEQKLDTLVKVFSQHMQASIRTLNISAELLFKWQKAFLTSVTGA